MEPRAASIAWRVCIRATRRYQLMQYNVPRSALPDAIKITPGKKSPTIQPLEAEGWVAVSVMVQKKVWA